MQFQTFLTAILIYRPVIIDVPDEKFNNNSKSFKNVHLDDRKSHFATFSNEQNKIKIIIKCNFALLMRK